jgi:oligopeptide/dipeptide ABC transporter ATP-binding protein
MPATWSSLSPVETIFAEPLHPYTQLLIESIPSIKERKPLKLTEGITHDLRNPPPGCIFQERCPQVMEVCRVDRPLLRQISAGATWRVTCTNSTQHETDFFMSEPLLDIKNATKVYGGTGFFSKGRTTVALQDFNLTIDAAGDDHDHCRRKR